MVTNEKEQHMSKSRGVRMSDGQHLSPALITDLGIKHGVYRADERGSVLARAEADPSGVLTAVCAGLRPARPGTPAPRATAASGASGAAGSAAYPSTWGRVVAAAQRIAGSRPDSRGKAAWATATTTPAQVAVPPTSGSGFYSKAPQPSAAAADQQSRYRADLQAMADEHAARYGAS